MDPPAGKPNSAELPDGARDAFRCPHCEHTLTESSSGLRCSDCAREYDRTNAGQIDLRLQEPRTRVLEYEYRPEFDVGDVFSKLTRNPDPQIDVGELDVPPHLTADLVSYFPAPSGRDSLALDFGCGDARHRDVCESIGYRWVGVDVEAAQAPILGDGHALPFADETFEFVLSMAVLQDVQNPFVVTRELYRVLEPGGQFIGSVAFLEEFYTRNFYNHSHLGTYSILEQAGFEVELVAPYDIVQPIPGVSWEGPVPQARKLFPGVPDRFRHALVVPVYALHRVLFSLAGRLTSLDAKAFERDRALSLAGQFCFVARKPRSG